MSVKNNNRTALMLLPIAIGTFMSALDTSVVNIALPIVQSDFRVAVSTVEWVITAYLLVISSMLLTFGRLSDLYGHKRIYLTGFVVFTAGSFMCGLSANIGMLVAFRVVQALGAGMMFSANSAIIAANVPAERRGKAFSVVAIAVAAACCAGPVAGGALASAWGWRSIFYINVPLGILGIVLAIRNIPADGKRTAAPFDAAGAVLVFAALFSVLLPLDLTGNDGISPVLFISLMACGFIFTAGFILHEKRAEHPMLKLDLFKNRVFSASLAAAVFNYMAQFVMAFLAPFYLENIRHLSPMAAGALYIPMPLAVMLAAPLSGSFSDRRDSRIVSSAGMGVMALGMFLLSFMNTDTPDWYIVMAMALAGLGSGMFQTPNNSAVMGNAPAEHRGAASGTLATMRNIGMVMGVAVSGALFNLNSSHAEAVYSAQGLSGPLLEQTSFTYGLHVTFIAAAIVALLAMGASLVKGRVRTAAPQVGTE